ncbi:MAG TPA: HEAT repeat domain-containing protein, partial [Terriglobales bacterium]|nr:HEAT repeat domain-containing protein [Terriglobales bacterium]
PSSSQNNSPTDPNVVPHVSVASEQSQFHIGEKIPLEVSYSAAVKDRYQINMAQYDRSGRMEYEHFHVTPEDGAIDPLANRMGGIGGGLTGFKFLDAQPWTIRLNLNEWVRFTKPGEYSLNIDSNRVSVRDSASVLGTSPIAVHSNEIKLKVVPATREWQMQVFKQAVADLDEPNLHDLALSEQNAKSKRAALETLRFLGAPESIHELTRRMRGEDQGGLDYICMLGVAYSPLPDVARSAVHEALADPNHPITQNFLYMMTTLGTNNRAPAMDAQHWRDERRRTLEELIGVLSKKQGKALAVSLSTAVNEAWDVPDLPKTMTDRLVEELVLIFDQLSTQEQNLLLTYRWDKIASPKLVPLLRRVAEHYEYFPQLREMNAYDKLLVSGSALRHWYEVDPEGARPAVIAEITRTRPRYSARVLGMLPDKTLPEADSALAEHLASADGESLENIASLIARYATDAILPQMLNKLDPVIGKWDCTVQDSLLAYVLRVNPAMARPRIEQAIAARGSGYFACNRGLFQGISEIHFDPVLEEIGIRSLDDPDPEVAMTAATMLGRFGSPAAESALLTRYQRWAQHWVGKESELNLTFAQSSRDLNNQLGLGQNLMMALATGQHWFSDDKKLEQLSQITNVKRIQNQMEQYLKTWQNRPLTMSFSHFGPYDEFHAQVAQYEVQSMEALKEKLAQFPAATKFALNTQSYVSPTDLKETAEIREFVRAHGMELVDRSAKQ